jgi:hypothetical protein
MEQGFRSWVRARRIVEEVGLTDRRDTMSEVVSIPVIMAKCISTKFELVAYSAETAVVCARRWVEATCHLTSRWTGIQVIGNEFLRAA